MAAVSQMALELIGPGRVQGALKLAGGYTNKVWRVFCTDGETYIAKQYRSPWTCANEAHAFKVLARAHGITFSPYARSATLLVWPDDGLIPPQTFNAGLARSVGYSLYRIHAHSQSDPPLGVQTMRGRAAKDQEWSWRTGNRVVSRLTSQGAIPEIAPVWIHGDPCLENVLTFHDGRFARFMDFEEFGLGDPRGDLAICCLEAASSFPDRGLEIVHEILRGYFVQPDAGGALEVVFQIEDLFQSLISACFDELNGWAVRNREEALSDRYRIGREVLRDFKQVSF